MIARLGPDLLARRRDVTAVRTRVTRSRMAVGALLMDQRLFNGVGNAFRSELLFRERLDPWTPGNALGADGFDRLWEEARRLLAAGRRTGRVSTVDRADLPPGQRRSAGRHLPPEDEASGSAVARARARETYVYKRAGLPWSPSAARGHRRRARRTRTGPARRASTPGPPRRTLMPAVPRR